MYRLIRRARSTSSLTPAWALALLAVFLLASTPYGAMAQIYSEDFESQSAGDQSDDDGVWSRDVSGADITSSGDYFEVKSPGSGLLLEGQDLDGPAIWATDQSPIDISNASNPQFSLVISESGDLEGGDYVDVEYSTDGGSSFTTIEDYDGLGDSNHTLTGNFGSVTVRKTGLSGSSLVLRVTMENSAGSEQLRLDDVKVTDPTLKFTPTETKAAENDGTTTLTVELLDATATPVDADVEFQSGASSASTSDIDGYSTQTVSFGSSASQGDTKDVTVNLTDDSEQEGQETAEFALTNVSGGEPTGGPFTLVIVDTEVVINEVLADPPTGDAGDANEDGSRSSSDDEFIEIYNNSSSTLDLSGFSLGDDGSSSRHTFPSTMLDPGEAVVVFGGGTPAASIPGVVQTATDGRLSLSNSGDDILVSDASDNPYLTFSYGSEGGDNQSLTRDPDFTGDFTKHSDASTNDALFSPGEQVGGDPLPVEMAGFDAAQRGSVVALTWETTSETNNAGFRVQRRAARASGAHQTQSDWTSLGFVESKASGGTTTEAQSYRYTVDRELKPGSHQFRLKQRDLNGTTSFSDVVSVNVGLNAALSLSTPAPNPVSGQATVSFAIKEKAEATVSVYNVLGQQVSTLYQGTPTPGEAKDLTFSTDGLPSGVYLVRLQADGQTRTQRVTVVK